MTIGLVSTSNPLASSLAMQGLTSSQIELVEADLDEALKNAGVDSGQSTSVDMKSVRAALDAAIADDVKKGNLSQDDAGKIGKALDQMDAAATTESVEGGASTGGGAPAGGAGGGGGGGASGSEKTEVSRTVTVSGGVKTTVILYSDGTNDTETSVDLSAKDTKAASDSSSETSPSETSPSETSPSETSPSEAGAKSSAATASAAQSQTGSALPSNISVQDYLSTIPSGSLFSAYA